MGWYNGSLNNECVSFFGFLGSNSSLFDFYLFDIFAQSSFDGLDDVGFISLEGIEVASSSDFELGNFCILFNVDNYVINMCTLLGNLLGLIARFALLEEA